jgi:hypothetical protein
MRAIQKAALVGGGIYYYMQKKYIHTLLLNVVIPECGVEE